MVRPFVFGEGARQLSDQRVESGGASLRRYSNSFTILRQFLRTRERLMNLKLVVALSLIAASPAYAQMQKQGGPPPNVPAPTKADVDKVVAAISADKNKLQAFCDLGKLDQQMAQAEQKKDNKALQTIGAKENDLSQKLGPDYLKLMAGLGQLDPDSPSFKTITGPLDALDGKCK
jgi:hypothetical protein